jgi:hypothetical protein
MSRLLAQKIERGHLLIVCKWVIVTLITYGLFLTVWTFLIKVNILKPQLDQWRIFERYEPPDWLQIVLVVIGFASFGVLYCFTQLRTRDSDRPVV